MKIPRTRIIVAAMLSGLIVAGAYATNAPRTVQLASATQADETTTAAPTIGDEHQGATPASSGTNDQGATTADAPGAGDQDTAGTPTGDASSPTDEPDPTPPVPQPRKLTSTVQRLEETPGQPLRVDVYCTYSFDDGTSVDRMLGNLPKPGLPGPQVQVTCPNWVES